jgi:hypothetical protein
MRILKKAQQEWARNKSLENESINQEKPRREDKKTDLPKLFVFYNDRRSLMKPSPQLYHG